MKPIQNGLRSVLCLMALTLFSTALLAQNPPPPPGEAPGLGTYRITQAEIENVLSLLDIRREGRRIFSTPFNKHDGFGDGPNGRPTLQNNGTFLRVDGLDSQSCLECHGVLSNKGIPSKFGVGGVGGGATNAFGGAPTILDPTTGQFNGRFINPPFVFGSGGVELLGKEMTYELQEIKLKAQANPGQVFPLTTHGINFGNLIYVNGQFDFSGVEGIDDDLVVRPFGRKGEFITTRQFDQGAMEFHFGIQPVEIVGNIDDDGDGYYDELTIGEMSALAIFNTTSERPVQEPVFGHLGFQLFKDIGCADCHVNEITSRSRVLTYSFPEIEDDPTANVFYKVDLTKQPTNFKPSGRGMVVPLFADLKRHDMGPGLAENTGDPDFDPMFTTARLWGLADTAPYLHDGRALTITEAILWHGGEAQAARDNFDNLSANHKVALLGYLRTLRTPPSVGSDL